MSPRRQYERPGGRVDDQSRQRKTPALLRGKPLRRIQREIYQRYYRYPHRNLLITALPKSGSTWLENMLLEVPGHFRWFPRQFNRQTLRDPGFHELPERDLLHPPPGYTVTKVHSGPSEHNQSLLREVARPFVILIRDPRDIAASWVHFVQIRPENAFHAETEGMSIEERLGHFAATLLDGFLSWAIGWEAAAQSCGGMLVRYEDLLADTEGVLRRVVRHLDLSLPEKWIRETASKHSFKATTGRSAGEADNSAFQRKGISGDWINCFTAANIESFRRVDAGRMERLGYAWQSAE